MTYLPYDSNVVVAMTQMARRQLYETTGVLGGTGIAIDTYDSNVMACRVASVTMQYTCQECVMESRAYSGGRPTCAEMKSNVVPCGGGENPIDLLSLLLWKLL